MSAGWLLLATLTCCAEPGSLALERDQFGRVAVQVGLGADRRYRFLLDTGSSLSSLTPRLAARLRLAAAGRVRATSVGEDGTLPLVRAPGIVLGARRLTIPWMAVLPDAIDHPLSRFDGVLGQDVLRQLNYLIDAASGCLWIDPPPWLVRRLEAAPLDMAAPAGPLTVRADAASVWTLDTGASHVVLFGEEAGAGGRPAQLVSAVGARAASWSAAAAVTLGGVQLRWTRAVMVPAGGRRDRGLLPLALFDALYVDNRRGVAHAVPRRSGQAVQGFTTACHGSEPDIAPHRGALEGDGGALRRPGGVADVPVR